MECSLHYLIFQPASLTPKLLEGKQQKREGGGGEGAQHIVITTLSIPLILFSSTQLCGCCAVNFLYSPPSLIHYNTSPHRHTCSLSRGRSGDRAVRIVGGEGFKSFRSCLNMSSNNERGKDKRDGREVKERNFLNNPERGSEVRE